MSDLEKIIVDLGANYNSNDRTALNDILEEVKSIASDISNNANETKLFPYIKKAVKSIYLSRGAEGLKSRNEGSISNSFEDIIDKLRNDIIKNRIKEV